jgi:hypothetical protein
MRVLGLLASLALIVSPALGDSKGEAEHLFKTRLDPLCGVPADEVQVELALVEAGLSAISRAQLAGGAATVADTDLGDMKKLRELHPANDLS